MTNMDMSSSENEEITSNNGRNKTVDLNTASLISKINEILICPISYTPIKDPLCGTDQITCEK